MLEKYPTNCTVIRIEDDNPIDRRRENAIRYWSNSGGELHRHGKEAIGENELPKPLRRAYADLWEEDAAGCFCYLAETKTEGYGVVLIGEYDEYYARRCNLTMAELFEKLLEDMRLMAAEASMKDAHMYALEYSGANECHELAVFVPANMPVAEFEEVKNSVSRLMFATTRPVVFKQNILRGLERYHKARKHRDVVFGEVFTDEHNTVRVPVTYRETKGGETVATVDVVVQGENSYWNVSPEVVPEAHFFA